MNQAPCFNRPYRFFIDAYDVNPELITLQGTTDNILRAALNPQYTQKDRNRRVYQFKNQHGEPFGVTAAYLLEDQRKGFRYRLPGHVTIHTWPELGRFAMDVVLPWENSNLIKALMDGFGGKYHISTEHDGIIIPASKLDAPVGREIVAYFPKIENTDIFREKRIQNIVEDVAKEAKFNVVSLVGRETLSYASGLAVLSTSHFSLVYIPETGECYVDIFTCQEDGKDEGDPRAGITLLEDLLKPVPHKDAYVIREPFWR